jgi:CyaY protein
MCATITHRLTFNPLFSGEFNMSNFNETNFLNRINETLQWVEHWTEELSNTHDFDIDSRRSGNVLELIFDNGSKIVINSQTPMRELWLASKLGGFHYRLDSENRHWLDTRTHCRFIDTLVEHLSHHVGETITTPDIETLI